MTARYRLPRSPRRSRNTTSTPRRSTRCSPEEKRRQIIMALVEVKVPDIGDFKDVEIIEVLVKPGDTIKAEQSLLTVESDKASMEIPSSTAGVVKELKVKLGDKVNAGDLIAVLEGSATRAPAIAAGAPVAATQAPAPAAERISPTSALPPH